MLFGHNLLLFFSKLLLFFQTALRTDYDVVKMNIWICSTIIEFEFFQKRHTSPFVLCYDLHQQFNCSKYIWVVVAYIVVSLRPSSLSRPTVVHNTRQSRRHFYDGAPGIQVYNGFPRNGERVRRREREREAFYYRARNVQKRIK